MHNKTRTPSLFHAPDVSEKLNILWWPAIACASYLCATLILIMICLYQKGWGKAAVDHIARSVRPPIVPPRLNASAQSSESSVPAPLLSSVQPSSQARQILPPPSADPDPGPLSLMI